MMDRESSDEGEGQENLIEQCELRNHESPSQPTFQISGTANTRRFNFSFYKRYYLLAIILPVFVLILYFTVDVKNLFETTATNVNHDASVSRMRESELQALYLLRQQQLGLFKLWNHTILGDFVNSSSIKSIANNNYSVTMPVLLELKSDLLIQISLNKQIHQALLSSHQLGNLSNASYYNNGGLNRCRKVDFRVSERRTIEWKPRMDKYLFAICVSGQMSNHLICLEKHMFFAALLNRVLVIPSSRVDYEFHRVLDIDHINKCLGREVVETFEGFAKSRKGHVHIDKFICYFSQPQPCFLDEERVKKLKSLGVSMNKLEVAWDEDVKNPKSRTVQDVITKFSSDIDVIAIGDVFFANVEKDWVMQPSGPILHKCKTLVEPSRLILLTAQRFIQTFLGENFSALHFRRHGFLKFCNAKNPSCFYPIPQAADCINRVVGRATTPVIYLSTDAAKSETGLLQSLLVVNGKTVPLVRRPSRNSAEKWDALLYRHGLEGDHQVEAMLDKTICALASVFIGSKGSTFTDDILRLRKDWGSASLCDEYLCQGELPNFIAEDE